MLQGGLEHQGSCGAGKGSRAFEGERAGQLATGSLRLTIEDDGTHCYELEYER
jgi:hypothetical protein